MSRRASAPVMASVGHPVSRRTAARRLAAAALGTALWPPTSSAARRVSSPPLDNDIAPLRLGSNENAHGLGPKALEAFQEGLRDANRYPYPTYARLRSALAEHHGVGDDQIMLAPGSTEILRVATQAFTSPSASLVTAAPTFERPSHVAEQIGAPVHAVPVQSSGALDLEGMAARAEGAGLFFVCNPNNPTGGVNAAEEVAALVSRVRRAAPEAVILVDEAYYEYVDDPSYDTAVPLARRDPRVIISRTFSKIHAMAGLRIGYAIGQADTLSAMEPNLGHNGLSNVGAAAALASLADDAHLAEQRTLNREARAFTREAFEEAGYDVLPSEANFLMVDVRRAAGAVQAACREAGVTIARPFPPLTTHARLSIGTMDEMRRATSTILSILSSHMSAHHEVTRMVEWQGEC